MTESTPPERRRPRVSRRLSVIVCLLVILVVLPHGYSIYRQRQIIAALHAKGLNVAGPSFGRVLPWWIQMHLRDTFSGVNPDLRDGSPRFSDDDLISIRQLFALANIGFLPEQCSLTLIDSPVTDRGLSHLKGLSNLRSLSIDSKHVTDNGLAQIAELRNLWRLELDNTRVTDAGLANLLKLPRLTTLVLDGAQFTDASVPMLSRFTKLTHLDLSRTVISDAGIVKVKAALPATQVK